MENSMEKRIWNIEQMEKDLNLCAEVLQKYEEILIQYREVQEKIRTLSAYYGSAQWREDFEDSENGRLPKDLKCGVLTEDAVWNLLTDNKELTVEMLETAVQILKN